MQHESITLHALEGIDVLRITQRTQCGRNDGLSLATGKQRRTVYLGQNANIDSDGANGGAVATIDTRFAANDATANNFLLTLLEGFTHIFCSNIAFIIN